MRQLLLVIALTAGMFSGAAWTQDIDPLQTSAEYWAELVAKRLEQQAQLYELMNVTTEEMAAIRQTKDRKQRRALMATHREHMQKAMRLMRGMAGEGMRDVVSQHMGSDMGPGADTDLPRNMHKYINSPRPRSVMSDAQRLGDLETRLDMMQIMIEVLLEAYAEQ